MVRFSAKELSYSYFEKKKSFVLFSRAGVSHIAPLEKGQNFNFDHAPGWVSYPFSYPKRSPVIYPFSALISIDDLDQSSEKPTLDWDSRQSSLSQPAYLQQVRDAISQIHNGTFDKVVLSRCVRFDILNSMSYAHYFYLWRDFYRRYPKAFVYLWFCVERGEIWIGASPELFLSLDTKGGLETHSIAGTLSKSEVAAWTKKEYMEQDYVSRHIKSELSELKIDAQVLPLEELRFGELMHLVSRIKASGVHKIDLPALVHGLFPTPAVCGFPKKEARKHIADVEGYDRSLYAGLVGLWWENEERVCDFYVNIRTVRFQQDQAFFYVGGGVLADSDPQQEWLETEAKLATLIIGFS